MPTPRPRGQVHGDDRPVRPLPGQHAERDRDRDEHQADHGDGFAALLLPVAGEPEQVDPDGKVKGCEDDYEHGGPCCQGCEQRALQHSCRSVSSPCPPLG